MHRTKNTILIIAVIIIVGCLVYIPGINDLGLYRDDWNNYYNAVVRGEAMLEQHYASDRPADGVLLRWFFYAFKTNNSAYLIYNLVCRILGAVFLALSLLIVWPRTPKMAGFAGLLAVLFPGFLQQIDGIAYVPHQTAMFCFLFSLWLTVIAYEPGVKRMRWVLTFLAMVFSFCSMLLMEYYVGMEIFRFGMIYMLNREQSHDGVLKAFGKCVLLYLPFLIPVAGFVSWRLFIFDAERAGADLTASFIQPFLAHPLHESGTLLVRIAKSVWKLFAGVWVIPAYNLINGLDMKSFVYAFIPAVAAAVIGFVFLFLMHRKRTEESIADAGTESAQWLWFGLICGTIAILPLIVAGRDINFSASLDRFAWTGMIGAILFLVGLLYALHDRVLRNALMISALLISAFVQWQNKTNYINTWQETKDYWQQLMWRAPGLKAGTTIVSAGAFSAEEDYEIFAPANLIYFSDEQGWAPIGAEILNRNTVRDIEQGKKTDRTVREIFVEKDYQQLLALTKPNNQSCLHVVNGENPIYSVNEWSKIPEIGSYSKLEQIITVPEREVVMPFFLGEEQEHGWCYYYEKMDLAMQLGDAETAAKLADEAAALKLRAEDSVEWIPVIEAYVETGRAEDAEQYAAILKDNEYMAFSACRYFGAKENAADYQAFTDILCN